MSKPNMDADRWISMKEVTEYVGVAYSWTMRMVHNNQFPAYKVGKRYKSKKSEIDEWIRSGKAADVPKKKYGKR